MDADKAREVLERLSSSAKRFRGHVEVVSLEAAVTVAATARTDALREAAEKLDAELNAMLSAIAPSEHVAAGCSLGLHRARQIILSLIKEPTQ